MRYRALIVEDDPQAADALRQHLARFSRERGLQFCVSVMGSALELLDGGLAADIIFLDIGLPGINGMEAAELLRAHDEVTPIIFVTDLAQYAVRGYAVDALDFMVKPVSYEDFALRMGRALRVLARNASASVTLPTPDGLRVIAVRDIIFVEILRHDLYWHVAGMDTPLRVRGSLSAAEKQLGEERFCRVAASHLVNMGQVALVRSCGVVMSDGTEIAFTRSRKKAALEQLARYVGGSV